MVRKGLRWAGIVALAELMAVALLLLTGLLALDVEGTGRPDPAAHGTGHDAEWLGHAWVDGRKGQSDVDGLANALRGTGIRDLFVHSGPFSDDGTLDPGLRSRARWLVGALHAALPGVRVQAWLGAHPVPGQLRLRDPATRTAVLDALGQVLDDGYDGVHLDFEPVRDGDPDLEAMLQTAHALTARRHAVLSLSASLLGPLPGMALTASWLPGPVAVWSAGYLHRLAADVDQVAVMAYDTWLPDPTGYAGYVRRLTALALAAVPVGVTLFIGVPAYHDGNLRHHRDVETMPAALRGVRLGLGPHPPPRDFGVAVYVDFTATAADWAAYAKQWARVPSPA